jgi:hypothetical protein
MIIDIEGIFLSPSYNLLITEKFAKKFLIDTNKNWITPFGYLDQANNSIISNSYFPDGTYVCLGWASYPGKSRPSMHIVGQFNLLKCRGIEIIAVKKFNNYPNLPDVIPIKPVFPLFRVGEISDWRVAKSEFLRIDRIFPTQRLELESESLGTNSLAGKICSMKLALERAIYSIGYTLT